MSCTRNCEKGCCVLKVKNCEFPHRRVRRGNCYKAGVFLYDREQDKVLLVQSRSHLWGPPKGSLEQSETFSECAIRELKEETGIDSFYEDFLSCINVKNRAMFYFLERKSSEVSIQEHKDPEKNDVNGITWIRIDCLEESIRNGSIQLNHYCKICFRKFLGKEFHKQTTSLFATANKFDQLRLA